MTTTDTDTDTIVAYMERERCDPETGEPGILRDEWRLMPWSEAYALAAIPDDGARGFVASGWPRFALEHRYIRRGVVEPWTFFDAGKTAEAVLGYVDSKAQAVDARLLCIQQDREHAAETEKQEHERRVEEQRQEHERRAREEASEAAFARLLNGPHGNDARQWNAFAEAVRSDEHRRAQLRDDREFRALYDAVMGAVTVPAKRKAIRAALDYADTLAS